MLSCLPRPAFESLNPARPPIAVESSGSLSRIWVTMLRKAVAVSITPLNISELIVTVASSWSCVWSWAIFASVLSRYFWFSSSAELSECSEVSFTCSRREPLVSRLGIYLDFIEWMMWESWKIADYAWEILGFLCGGWCCDSCGKFW